MRGRERSVQASRVNSLSTLVTAVSVSRPTACEACGGRRGAVVVRFECSTQGEDNTPKKRRGWGFH